MTLQEIVKQKVELRDKLRDLSEQEKEINKKIAELDAQVMEKLEAEGLDKTSITGLATVSIAEQTVPNVTDWEAFGNFILENKYLEFLHRRVSSKAYEEFLTSGEEVPGVEPRTIKKINMRSL